MQVPPPDGASGPPRRRSDAERNRGKILTAARQAYADADAEVSMATVARRAGVGMATLYRNFPGRRELLEALFSVEVDEICAAAATVAGATPGDRLEEWLRRLFFFFASKRPVASELLKHTDAGDPVFGANRDRVLDAGRPLLDAAQRDGTVRGDLDLDQILDMIHALASINDHPGRVQPILDTALTGLRTPGVVHR